MDKYSNEIYAPNIPFPCNVKPKKSLGQNFLVDKSALSSIVDSLSLQKEDRLLEIGAGYGALTQELVRYSKHIDIVEVDKDLSYILNQKYSARINVHNTDALCFSMANISSQKNKIRIIGNLPYNISTQLLFRFFDEINFVKDMHFLVQKEVAERIVAKPGAKSYGRLSIMSQFYCDVKELLVVYPESFFPKPKILSSFVKLVPKFEKPQVKSFEQFKYVIKRAFQCRRKKIKNNLVGLLDLKRFKKELPYINLELRPENIGIEDYIKISDHVSDMCNYPISRTIS